MSAMTAMVAASLAVSPAAQAEDDKYQWLEEPYGAKQLEWAAERTGEAQARIAKMPGRAEIETELRTALAAGDPPPKFYLLGPRIFRFQRSLAHPHGLLSVAARDPSGAIGAWRDVLDIDALRKAEKQPYELDLRYFNDGCLPPDYTRCILPLSPAGSDDIELREFDIDTGTFVADGFRVPAGRGSVAWIDRDHLLIQHAAIDGPKLAGGWPMTTHLWARGTPLASAKLVFTAKPGDAMLSLNATGEGRDRVGIISRLVSFSSLETLLVRPDGTVESSGIPMARSPFLFKTAGHSIFTKLTAPATIDGRTLPTDTLVAYDTRRDTPGDRRISVVQIPDGQDFLSGFGALSAGKTTLRLAVDRRGVKRIDTARFRDGAWTITRGTPEPVGVTVSVTSADPASDAVIVQRTGYLLPTRLDLEGVDAKAPPLFAEEPSFDASRFTVELKSATSKDGTEIDYFLLRPKAIAAKGATPTLMTGYGAFGASLVPGYLDVTVGGRSLVPWLNRGGALALPLIRGGSERGDAWHQAAMRDRRQNSYDDFIAVTEALIKDGFTKPEHIGVFGMSNGGLLSATMGTQRPDLFGAIVTDVPLTDLIRMPLMGTGAIWTNEYGDPKDPKMAAYIRTYSPFQNVRKGVKYPPFMVTVATSDNRVGPGHARKIAARLIDAGSEVYYLEDQEGGHGVSDPLSRPGLMADRITFFIDTLR